MPDSQRLVTPSWLRSLPLQAWLAKRPLLQRHVHRRQMPFTPSVMVRLSTNILSSVLEPLWEMLPTGTER